MLRLIVPGEELYDEAKATFSNVDASVLEIEHSLLSLSKWESEFEKSFLSPGEKTPAEVYGYVRAMIVSSIIPPNLYTRLTQENLDQIQVYIDSKQSATTFGLMPERKGKGEIITSELIYYWMVSFNIPFECEQWHLNRLFALIRICNLKNSKPKRMSRHEYANRCRELNAQRRAQLGTNG